MEQTQISNIWFVRIEGNVTVKKTKNTKQNKNKHGNSLTVQFQLLEIQTVKQKKKAANETH